MRYRLDRLLSLWLPCRLDLLLRLYLQCLQMELLLELLFYLKFPHW